MINKLKLILVIVFALRLGPGYSLRAGNESADLADSAPQIIDYKKHVQPIFADHCYTCHGPEKQKNGLRLDRRQDALDGGDSGPAFAPGKSAESRLYRYVAGLDPEITMPPKGERLTTNQIALLKAWIDVGAPWPDDSQLSTFTSPVLTNHWAFISPRRPSSVPDVKNATWARNSIDSFIVARHEQAGLVAAPEASRRVLIRRLALDLTGLPPTSEEVDGFITDRSPDAYEKLVEYFLASPHYGERWGRHWLDLARWAETDGYEANEWRSSAWRYRDYVVNSFNADKPYDQFLREQIAGDEIGPYSDENLIATGFLAAGRVNNNEEDKAVQRNEFLVDIANATASVVLGLTLNCAQCHDHKFDPLTIQDYYRFQGFFLNGQVNSLLLRDPEEWKAYEAAIPPELEATRNLRKLLYGPVHARLKEEARKSLSPETQEALNIPSEKRTPAQKELAEKAEKILNISKDKVEKALGEDDQKLLKELDKKISNTEKLLREKKPQTWGFYSPATSPHKVEALTPRGMYPLAYEPAKLQEAKPRVLKRGDVHRPGSDLESGWPAVLGPVPEGFGKARNRLQLADWLTGRTNPLVSRVWVNHIWQHHFGRGLVTTSGDFGTRGAKPTHPELLDWLAIELTDKGWSTKHIHRLIVLSGAYRQGSQPQAKNSELDPDNQFIWRWSPRRLEAESIRDAALRLSGELDLALGGPSVAPEDEENQLRRSIYLRQKRHEFPAMLALFDSPSAHESCPRRHVSTVPLQPLYMMNGGFLLKRAKAFAARVFIQAGLDEPRQIETAFLMALGRPPDDADRQIAQAFYRAESANSGIIQASSTNCPGEPGQQISSNLVRLCHALLNLNEFVYLE